MMKTTICTAATAKLMCRNEANIAVRAISASATSIIIANGSTTASVGKTTGASTCGSCGHIPERPQRANRVALLSIHARYLHPTLAAHYPRLHRVTTTPPPSNPSPYKSPAADPTGAPPRPRPRRRRRARRFFLLLIASTAALTGFHAGANAAAAYDAFADPAFLDARRPRLPGSLQGASRQVENSILITIKTKFGYRGGKNNK